MTKRQTAFLKVPAHERAHYRTKGYVAGKEGTSRGSNPYNLTTTDKGHWWDEGWMFSRKASSFSYPLIDNT